MKKKGFTLIELLAVIAILAIIIVISVPKLLNLIGTNKERSQDKVEDIIISAARNYTTDYDVESPTVIDIDDLCGRYLDCPVINLLDNTEMEGFVLVDESNNYAYINSSDIDLQTLVNDLTTRITNLQTLFAPLDDTLDDLDDKTDDLYNTLLPDSILLDSYPVGSIYISVSNTNPGTLFGGTWISFGSGRSLVGANTSDTAEVTGGNKTITYTPVGTVGEHTLTISEIPSHTHTFTGTAHNHQPGSSTTTYFVAITSGGDVGENGTARAWWSTTTSSSAPHLMYVTHSTYNSAGGAAESNTTAAATAAGTNSNTGGGGSHTHPFTGTAATLKVQSPYITTYMWKRTA